MGRDAIVNLPEAIFVVGAIVYDAATTSTIKKSKKPKHHE
jgi:hypothetical protein